MNKIYKVIWNKARNCYMAVAEFVKRQGKSSSGLNRRHIGAALGNKTAASLLAGKAVAAALLAASVVCGVPGMAMANSGGEWRNTVLNPSQIKDYVGVSPLYTVYIDDVDNGSLNLANVIGAYRTGDKVKGTVTVTGLPGVMEPDMQGVYGGYQYSTASRYHTVNINGGIIAYVYGGYSISNSATDNVVTVNGANRPSISQHVTGGFTEATGNENVASRNTVTIGDGTDNDGNITINGDVIGGNNKNAFAQSNTVTIHGGNILNVYGGYSENGYAGSTDATKGNHVYIHGGTIGQDVYGGRAGGYVYHNTATVDGGTVNGNVYGGQSVLGDAKANEVTVSGGTLGRFTYVYGGLSEQGAAGGTAAKDGNKVTITGGTVGTVQGGYSRGDASHNSVVIAGGTVQGTAYGGQSTQGNALNNSVTVKEGTAGGVFGGYTKLTGMKAAGNKVTITGGTVWDVYGGWVEDTNEIGDSVSGSPNPATATENTVEIRGGKVNGSVYGGRSALGSAERNTVILAKEARKNAPNLDNAILYGGFGSSVSDNTLQVEAVGLSALQIMNFDNYKFVLPSDIKAGDTMLKLKGQGEDLTINADYVNLAVFNNAAPGMALLGESITLVEKAGGNGTFGVDGLKTGGEEIYPLWLDGQEGIEVADYSLTADSTRLDMKLEGLYLYGEGGTNTPGQRQSGNTLNITDGTKATAAFGGRVNIGDVTGNKVTMSGGELVTTDVTHPNYGLSGNVYGGLAEDGAATGNRVTLDGGKLRAAYGGFSFAGTAGGEGEGLGNSVTVRGGQVAEGVYGGYAVQKDAAANLVAVSGGTVSGAVVGGYAEIGNAIKNTVTLEGKGNINGNVIAGQSEKGEVRANTITAKGGLVAGSLFGGRSERGEVRANTLTVEGGEIKGRLTLGQVSGTLTGGLSSKGGSVKNAITLSGGIFTGAVSVTGGSSPVKEADNVVNLTGTTKGLEGATLRGYSDATAAHSGNELHVGGVKAYDASGNATITKASWQGTASTSNGTGTLLRTAALQNTAGASGGTAQQGAAGSGTNGNRVDTVANFDSIALHNVVWGDTPALSAKTIENIGGLDVTGLEFFTHPDNSTVHEHALKDYMVLLHADNNELAGMKITYLDEGKVKTEALTNQGINYHKVAHHSEENGVTVDGSEVKRIYLADHNKSVDFFYHVDGTKITLGDVEFVKGGTARFLDGRFDVRKAAIDADSLKMTEASLQKAAAGDTMTVLDAEDAVPNATGQTLTGFTTKEYNEPYRFAPVEGVTVAARSMGSLTLEGGRKLTYKVNANKAERLTFGRVAWKDSGALLKRPGNITFAGAEVDTQKIHFTNVEQLKANQKMTLVSDFGNSVGTITGDHYTVGTTLHGKGKASLQGSDLIYTVETGTHKHDPDPVPEAQPQTHNVLMAMTAGMQMVKQGGDFMNKAASGLGASENTDADGSSVFAAVGGGAGRTETGSHVKTHTWNGIVAVGASRKIESGTFQWGVFGEYGKGNYSLHNDTGRGDGDAHYAGGGLLAKWTNKHDVYTEVGVRLGRMSDKASDLLEDADGNRYGYDIHTNYYGAHLGFGKVFRYKGGRSLDVYGKYFYTKRDGADFEAGGHYSLDSVKSSVLRVGARYGTSDKRWNWYGGLAYEYEFDGKSTGTADGRPIRAASIKGGSVRGEVGLRMEATQKNPWQADISLTGYAGRHRGFGGNVSVAYTF